MMIHLTSLGAAGTVTGSCHLVETDSARFLLDCGLFQGAREEGNNVDFGTLDPSTLDAVILSHAHLDHCGRLPYLVRQGFRGPIHCTTATRDLARIVMLDAAKLQEEAARRAARRREEGKRFDEDDLEPLYTAEDVEETLTLFKTAPKYGTNWTVADGVHCTFRDAGHILGSAFVELNLGKGDSAFRLTFSGDLGNLGKPIVRDPATPSRADAVILESTYGDRNHRSFADSVAELRGIVAEVVERRGCILIPSFAIERTQELLWVFHGFFREGLLGGVPVYVDSPMATEATRVFTRHPEFFDAESHTLANNGLNPFEWGDLAFLRDADESRRLNTQTGPLVIIAPSGMCTGGRIAHHLRQRLDDPTTTVVFMGFQSWGTLGRRLVDGADRVRIYGREVKVDARIETINGFSAHADRDTLLRWLGQTDAHQTFLVHGEPEKTAMFRQSIHEQFPDMQATASKRDQRYRLDGKST